MRFGTCNISKGGSIVGGWGGGGQGSQTLCGYSNLFLLRRLGPSIYCLSKEKYQENQAYQKNIYLKL